MNEPQARSDRERHRVGTTFSGDELLKIDEWGFARRIRNRSEAIRLLVRSGLEKEMPALAGK